MQSWEARTKQNTTVTNTEKKQTQILNKILLKKSNNTEKNHSLEYCLILEGL